VVQLRAVWLAASICLPAREGSVTERVSRRLARRGEIGSNRLTYKFTSHGIRALLGNPRCRVCFIAETYTALVGGPDLESDSARKAQKPRQLPSPWGSII
jgi:hypothetical protein